MSDENDDGELSTQKLIHFNDRTAKETLPKLSTVLESTGTTSLDRLSSKEALNDMPSGSAAVPINKNQESSDYIEKLGDEDWDQELHTFDWMNFESQYTEALKKIDKEEGQILDEFDQLMEMFFIWAQTGSSHETERSVKRLKTRERFVQLSEDSFEKKRAHYIQVVSAFKSALDLLRD